MPMSRAAAGGPGKGRFKRRTTTPPVFVASASLYDRLRYLAWLRRIEDRAAPPFVGRYEDLPLIECPARDTLLPVARSLAAGNRTAASPAAPHGSV